MRNYYATLIFILLSTLSSLAQQEIEADIRIFSFQTDDDDILAEVYVGILESSLNSIDSQSVKGVNVKLIVKSGNDIKLADKYILSQSPGDQKDFYHIQRILLKPGTYDFEIELTDIQNDKNRTSRVIKKQFFAPSDKIAISSIQLLGNLEKSEGDNPKAKNGLLMEPLKFEYLNTNYEQILAYTEIYNTPATFDTDYILRYMLIRDVGGKRDTMLTRYKRRKAVDIDPIVISEHNDSTYTSGKYDLAIAVLDFDKNVVAADHATFLVSRRLSDEAEAEAVSFADELTDPELVYALKSLTAKVNSQDVDRLDILVNDGTRAAQISFLTQFWELYSPVNPKNGYLEYMKVVKAIDYMYYDGLGHGFETDRGYYYLKYGRPDQQISVEDEADAPPYEIWIYSYFPATRQNNVKFVFYNPASTTYELLHTNARGELNDPQWLVKLYSNSQEQVIGNTIDARRVQDNWTRRAEDIYNDN